jgi:hypothetical protein
MRVLRVSWMALFLAAACGGGGTGGDDQVDQSCRPSTCTGLGLQCGSASDGCGGTVSCGTCSEQKFCSATQACVDRLVATTEIKGESWPPTSTYPAGYCQTVTVTNQDASPTTSWTLVVDVGNATIISSYDCARTGTTGQVTLVSVDLNKALATGASAAFGFCATFTGTLQAPVIVSATGAY